MRILILANSYLVRFWPPEIGAGAKYERQIGGV
jgi:hypothetical protein